MRTMFIALFALPVATAHANPTLTLAGDCPGPVDIDIADAAGERVAIVYGAHAGSDAVDVRSCGAVATGLGGVFGPMYLSVVDGGRSMSPTVPSHICDGFVQVVDLVTCETSHALPMDPTVIPPHLDGAELLVNGGLETGDWTGWTILSEGGDGFDLREADGAYEGAYELRTSFGMSTREQVVDLIASGFTEAQLDAAPPIDVSSWYRELCAGPDTYTWTVDLLDAEGGVLATFGEEILTEGAGWCDYSDDEWLQMSAQLTDYGPGVRQLRFEDGGHDTEFFAGYYGIRIDAASVSIGNPAD